jgi:hypothetical protein
MKCAIVDDDLEWQKFLDDCEQKTPWLTAQNNKYKKTKEKYDMRRRIVMRINSGRWSVIDRKFNELIAWGKEKTSALARESALVIIACHVKQRCPKGNTL